MEVSHAATRTKTKHGSRLKISRASTQNNTGVGSTYKLSTQRYIVIPIGDYSSHNLSMLVRRGRVGLLQRIKRPTQAWPFTNACTGAAYYSC